MRSILLVASLLMPVPVSAQPIQLAGVVLLQPESVFQQRMGNSSTLAAYVRSVQDATAAAVQSSGSKPSAGGFLVVALRPGGKSNAWLDFEPILPPSLATSIVFRVRSVEVPAVSGGTVVFALKLSLWGGAVPAKVTPMPVEWQAAAQKAGWPQEASALAELSWNE